MIAFLALILSIIAVSPKADPREAIEKDVRSNIVKVIILNQGTCSGGYVKGKSGKTYVLTAAHCAKEDDEYAETEGSTALTLITLVDKDVAADVAIYAGPEHAALRVAKDTKIHERIFAVSFGGNGPAFLTEGELLDTVLLKPADDYITVVRTTMPVIPGSSGAPVLDSKGEIIGTVSVDFPELMLFSGISQLKAIQKILNRN